MIITAVWPAAWNWRSFSRTTTWPRWMSGAVGSMPSLTRSGRPSSRRRSSSPAGSTSTAPRVSSVVASPPSRPDCRIGANARLTRRPGAPEAGACELLRHCRHAPEPERRIPRPGLATTGPRHPLSMPESKDNTFERRGRRAELPATGRRPRTAPRDDAGRRGSRDAAVPEPPDRPTATAAGRRCRGRPRRLRPASSRPRRRPGERAREPQAQARGAQGRAPGRGQGAEPAHRAAAQRRRLAPAPRRRADRGRGSRSSALLLVLLGLGAARDRLLGLRRDDGRRAGPARPRGARPVRRGPELGRPRQRRHAARDPDRQREADPGRVGRDLAVGQAGGRRDRGRALLRAPRHRLPRHRPRPAAGHRLRRRRPGRLDDHPAVRQERARGAGQPDRPAEAPRGGARLPDRAPVVEGQDPHQLPQQHLLRQRRLRDRGGRPDLLRHRPSRLRRARQPLRRGADPGRGGDAGGDDLLADRLRPGHQPRRRAGAAQRRAPEDARPGRARGQRRGLPGAARHPGPDEARHPAARPWTRRPPTSPTGCASRSSTSTAPARPSAAASSSSRRSTTASSRPPSRRVSDNVGGLGPTSAVVAIDNGSGEVLAMVGGQDFDDSPFNLATNGQRQPGSSFKPFTLVTALEGGPLARRDLRVGPAGAPVRGDDPDQERREEGGRRTTSASTTTTTTTSAPPRSRPATTYSDNSVYAQLGIEVGINDIVKTAHELGISSQARRQPGDDPRRPQARRDAARDGLRLQHAGQRRRPDQRHRGQPGQRQGPGRDRQGRRPGRQARPRQPRRQRREREGHRPGASTRPSRRPRPTSSTPSSPAAPASAPRSATTTSGARPARPTTTPTPGSSAPTRTSPSPSGSATRTGRRRWRPSSAALPGRRRHDPGADLERRRHRLGRPAGRRRAAEDGETTDTTSARPTPTCRRRRRPSPPATTTAPAPVGPGARRRPRPRRPRRRPEPAPPDDRHRRHRRPAAPTPSTGDRPRLSRPGRERNGLPARQYRHG